MTAHRLMALAGTATIALALSQGAALAHARHHVYHHHVYHHHVYHHHVYYHPVYYRHARYHHYYHRYAAREAGYYGRESAYVDYPYGGPRVIESSPVPDTPYNRMRFGGPMSYGGRMTAPIGN